MPRHPTSLLALLAAALVLASGSGCGGGAPPAGSGLERLPNVLLLVADDQGTELGCYGVPAVQTPHLDALAASGVRFTRAYATTAVCTPSRSALYTGLYPARNGASGFQKLNEGVKVWTEHLSQAGWRTGLIGKLGARPPKRFDFDWSARTRQVDEQSRELAWHVASFRDFLGSCSGDEPWALVVNFRDSHWPFPEDGAPFGDEPPPPHDPGALRVPPILADTPATRAELARYYDGLRRLDATVGALLAELAPAGAEQDTLVMFTSDNGPPFPRGKTTLYEWGIRQPLIARWPGVTPPGRTEDSLVSLVDVIPTLLDLAQRPAAGLDGRSLLPLLRGESPADWPQAVFASHTEHRQEPAVPGRSIITPRWKYTRCLRPGLEFRNLVMQVSPAWTDLSSAPRGGRLEVSRETFLRRPAEELYDLEADPWELTNLAADPLRSETLEQLRGRLRQFCQAQGDPLLDEW